MNAQLDVEPINPFDRRVLDEERRPLHALDIDVIQVNMGLVCNLQCTHCHVAAGPRRTELMSWQTMQLVLAAARRVRPRLLDLTGGTPEMNPDFRRFVSALRDEDFDVIVRTSLTILLQSGYEAMAPFMAERRVGLVASLPCYSLENVDAQRGAGAHTASVRALQMLNGLGYGIQADLPLELVYNPLGPALPPSQGKLEEDYRRELHQRFGIRFTRLHTITNMPIGRFWADLRRQRREDSYQNLLEGSFNPRTLPGLMCRHQISVDWNGTVHDCDFNLALQLPVNHGAPMHIRDFDPVALEKRRIATGRHCFGCTAGCGSSCGGALVEEQFVAE